MGQGTGALVGFNSIAGSSSEVSTINQEQKLAAESLYRDANTLIYGDSKPSEDAIDRVVSKINKEYVFLHQIVTLSSDFCVFLCSIDKKGKFSRKRLNEEEGDITYINEHNRVFNKKVCRDSCVLCFFLIFISLFPRLLDTTTNTRPKSVRVSNEEPLFNPALTWVYSRFLLLNASVTPFYMSSLHFLASRCLDVGAL